MIGRDSMGMGVRRSVMIAGVTLLLAALAGRGVLAQDSTSVAASQEIRIQQLENEIRSLTGLIETLTYQVQQMSGRLDKLVADSDYRFRSLEGGTPLVAGGVPPTSAATQASALPAATQPLPPPPSDQPALLGETTVETGIASTSQQGGSGQVGQPQTLGTLTQTQYDQQVGTLNAPPSSVSGEAAGQEIQSYASTQPVELPGATPDEQYQYAFGLLRQAKYADAEAALRRFMEINPSHPLAGNANYWLGETYYVRSDYNQAALIFANGYQNYPKSGKAPDSLLKLGMALSALGETADACVAFAELEQRYPGASDTVKQRLAQERGRNGC